METAVAHEPKSTAEGLKGEFGPISRLLAARFFEPVRFPSEAQAELARLHERGFVVHVMRTTAWINYLYLAWALVRRGLPPIRAVVNLRRWFTRPWRRTAQRGDFDVRFIYARRQGGSGLVFLKRTVFGVAKGQNIREDPFTALVAMVRRGDRNVFLVPELFIWEKWHQRLKPGVMDFLFGSPEAPGFLHTLLAFLRNYHSAQFRVGEPIDLKRFVDENPTDSDEVIARKVRGALHHHLAQESRAVFGPPLKPIDRLLDEAMRDRVLRKRLEEVAGSTGRRVESVQREALRNLKQIAARYSPTVVGVTAPVMRWVFHRIYDGIEIDEEGFDHAMRAGSKAPVVLVPSHKSHIDYLVMSYVLWQRGYTVPLVAAGANLSFWPLGPYLRRCGAFFLRRSFKGEHIYAAAFRAYVKKLVHDGVLQEFFPEGGRSRTGKLLSPKLGMLTWEVDAVLEGARNDLMFVPVSIDYERIVESSSYSRELAGGEKKPEDLRALLSTPKVLASRYGRIHLSFNEPISVATFMRSRGLAPGEEATEDQKKGLVRALGHRIMWGIVRVSTVTPHALFSSALLAHRRRGIGAKEVAERIALLRRIAELERARFSPVLRNAPSDPTGLGPIQDAVQTFCRDGIVRTQEAKGEIIYQADDERRSQLSFYKNTLMNLVVPVSLVSAALLGGADRQPLPEVRERARFLSRLFKFEFIFRVGWSFDTIFSEHVDKLSSLGLLTRTDGELAIAPEPHARAQLEFLADLLRDFLESYLLAAITLGEVGGAQQLDKKGFVKAALETGRGEFLAGRIGTAEALSRTNLENALAYLLDQGLVIEENKQLRPGPAAAQREALVTTIRRLLRETRG